MSKKIDELLNPKQLDFLIAEDKQINLLTGSVRSGKTYISLFKWAMFVHQMPLECEFLMTGKTITSLKRNCLGLLTDLVGTNNFTYSIGQKMGKLFGRTIWLEGASDSRSESKIRGMTLAGAYIDELTQIPFEFYEMLISRLSIKNAKLYATTNPDNPTHWVKKLVMDNDDIDKKIWTFTFDDNEILKRSNPEYFENTKKTYLSMGGVFYERFILGRWVVASGGIYQQFIDNPDLFIKDNADGKNFMIISIGIDYGASRSSTAFKCTGITPFFKEVWTLEEVKIEGIYSPDDFYKSFVEFYYNVISKYNKVTHVFADWGSLGEVITFGLNRYLQQNRIPIQVQNCIKGKIIERIELDCQLFAQSRRFILKNCQHLINAYKAACWEEGKEDVRLDNNSYDVDSLDANEYSYFSFYDKLVTNIKGGYR